MTQPFFGAGLILGGFVAERLGPVWWLLYWLAVALQLVRYAAVLWTRLELRRMAVAVVVGAGLFGSFGLLGTGQREVSELIGHNWPWLAALIAAMMGLLLWEGRESPEGLRLLKQSVQTARFRDWFTLRHIPELRRSGL